MNITYTLKVIVEKPKTYKGMNDIDLVKKISTNALSIKTVLPTHSIALMELAQRMKIVGLWLPAHGRLLLNVWIIPVKEILRIAHRILNVL